VDYQLDRARPPPTSAAHKVENRQGHSGGSQFASIGVWIRLTLEIGVCKERPMHTLYNAFLPLKVSFRVQACEAHPPEGYYQQLEIQKDPMDKEKTRLKTAVSLCWTPSL
jgi:hypothetical protein